MFRLTVFSLSFEVSNIDGLLFNGAFNAADPEAECPAAADKVSPAAVRHVQPIR
jgi:hypothetical protein